MKNGCEKYIPFTPINIPDRQWPSKVIEKPPVWCSVDLRDGNQALIDPMNLQEKIEYFKTLVKIGFKEIEVGFPSASETEYTEIEVSELPFTLTDLTPMTDYTAYVMTDCGGELSTPSTTISFRTSCSTIETFPYFEGFNNSYNFQDLCWSTQQISGYYNWNINIDGAHGNYPYEGSQCAKINYFTGEARLISPIMDLSLMSNPYLKYVVANPAYEGNAEQIIVEYKASPESDWVTLKSYTSANEVWLLDSVALPSPTDVYQIAFKAIGANGWGASIDAVQVYDAEEGQHRRFLHGRRRNQRGLLPRGTQLCRNLEASRSFRM